MEYFWKQYEDLPAGLGFGRFSPEHLLTLAVIAAVTVAFALWFSRQREARRRRVLKVIPVLMILLECWKIGFLLRAGHFGPGYLPLHLCSLGVFVFLLCGFSRTDRWRAVFAEIAVTLILPGAVAALLFPDWVHLYPVWNFLNLYGFAWHGMLLLYPVLLLVQRQPHLSPRHFHYDLLFLAVTVPPVLAFDRAFHCNYMFVNWPPAGTPLALIAQITGERYYLAGYAVFAAAVIGLIYLGIWLVQKARG